MLKQRAYEVLAAPDTDQGEEIFGQLGADIDLLVTDVALPGRSGPELSKRMAKCGLSLKVLFVSRYGDTVFVPNGISETGAAFFLKPFTLDHLLSKVREVLDLDEAS